MTQTGWLALSIASVTSVAVITLMLLSFRRWSRTAAVPQAANRAPSDLGIPLAAVEGEYITTTLKQAPLKRITSYGLGFKALGALDIHPAGIVLIRRSDTDFFIPSHDIVAVERGDGLIGKFVEKRGLIIVTWLLGEEVVQSGFRARYAADTQRCVDVSRELFPHLSHHDSTSQNVQEDASEEGIENVSQAPEDLKG